MDFAAESTLDRRHVTPLPRIFHARLSPFATPLISFDFPLAPSLVEGVRDKADETERALEEAQGRVKELERALGAEKEGAQEKERQLEEALGYAVEVRAEQQTAKKLRFGGAGGRGKDAPAKAPGSVRRTSHASIYGGISACRLRDSTKRFSGRGLPRRGR